jgi:hypothetical protein
MARFLEIQKYEGLMMIKIIVLIIIIMQGEPIITVHLHYKQSNRQQGHRRRASRMETHVEC